jgi:hypothetical protein
MSMKVKYKKNIDREKKMYSYKFLDINHIQWCFSLYSEEEADDVANVIKTTIFRIY